ncbi:MAG TPA: hypothetical protein V6C76_11685 [Drouetiella sp.]
MSEKGLPPELLKAVENYFAEGLSLENVADLLGFTHDDLKSYKSSNLEFAKAVKDGEERAKLIKRDKKRLAQIEKESRTFFIPTIEDLERIEELARLSWSEVKIAECFNVSLVVWTESKKKSKDLQEYFERGRAGAEGRLDIERMNMWRPKPEDLVEIERLASCGYTLEVISKEMRLNAHYLRNHIKSIPELQTAYANGLANWEKEMTDLLMEAIRNRSMYTQSNIIYMLKARKKQDWHDAAPLQQQALQSTENKPTINYNIKPMSDAKSFTEKAAAFRERKANS